MRIVSLERESRITFVFFDYSSRTNNSVGSDRVRNLHAVSSSAPPPRWHNGPGKQPIAGDFIF